MKRFLSVLLLSILPAIGLCQPGISSPRTLSCDCPIIIQQSKLSTFPPVTTDMPWDVLVGYIGGDGIARNLSLDTFNLFLKNATYADTVKQGLKYLYEMVDYDPMTFFLWNASPTVYSSAPGVIRESFLDRVAGWGQFGKTGQLFAGGRVQAALCHADIIADIRVVRTDVHTDSRAGRAPTAIIVTASIIDTIKGKLVPDCIDFGTVIGDKKKVSPTIQSTGTHHAVPGSCLQFDYRTEWTTAINDDDGGLTGASLADSGTTHYMKTDSEYVVFLQYQSIGTDSAHYYATLFPTNMGLSHYMGMYPVIAGRVHMPDNDFGYGTDMTVDDFKTALRGTIYSITHP